MFPPPPRGFGELPGSGDAPPPPPLLLKLRCLDEPHFSAHLGEPTRFGESQPLSPASPPGIFGTT